MDKGYEAKKALGLPVYIDTFADKQQRLLYPCKLKNITDFQLLISLIDREVLSANVDETRLMALSSIISMSFNLQGDELIEVLNQVDDESYPMMIQAIMDFNDIHIKEDDDGPTDEVDLQDNWDVEVSVLLVYTSMNIGDILELTLHQFKQALARVNTKINFETKVATLQNAKEPETYIAPEDYPLYVKEKRKEYMTMDDLHNLMGGA